MKTASMQQAPALSGDGIHNAHSIPHAWDGERCERCGMHRDWPGARHGCEGYSANRHGLLSASQRERKRQTERERRARIMADPVLAAIRRERVRAAHARSKARKRAELP